MDRGKQENKCVGEKRQDVSVSCVVRRSTVGCSLVMVSFRCPEGFRYYSRTPFSSPSYAAESSPASSAVGWRAGVRSGEVVECHFGGVFFRIVEVLAVVPKSCGEGASVDGDSAGPGGTAACDEGDEPLVTPTDDKNDLEYWWENVCLAAGVCESLALAS
ncbi:hypothetical protein CCHR01_19717 [Colletotrichum chrysophilum]|uniref:Uncharacterized protein n=1 Tax=Colletotrichum chrysophilum TaxID=1836956 RepID=A0AAD9E7K7_9PEZI|nr:hypothetical protein CCHR01_19717 [Colletotrichum chrysophilum]